MFLEKIKSEGLAHLSWIFGDGNEAFVIDPRRDCQVYVDTAARQGMRITRIFETHRNEDYVIGSVELARLTGASIHHGAHLDFGYGNDVVEGDTFECGALRLEVPAGIGPLPVPRPLSADEVEERVDAGARVLDLRSVWHLVRMGFESIAGYAKGGMTAWQTSGRRFGHIDAIDARSLNAKLESGDDFTLLDVRKITEFKEKRLKGARHVFLGHLPDELDGLDRQKPVVTFCGSGQRAIVAASILKAHGFEDVANAFGSMEACVALDCSMLEKGDA